METAELAAVLAWGALKGALLLAAAGLATLALRRASAAVRHAVWSVALLAALVLPALDLVVPAWRLAVLPAAEAGVGAEVARPAGAPWVAAVLLGVWLLGLLVVAARWAAAARSARRLVARSLPMADGAWRRDAYRIADGLGIRGPVELRESAALRSPVAWGVLRHVLIVPVGAADWSAERRIVVLTHELSHVRRRDCLTGLVAEAACALHWFDPLAWLAYRRLHVERERACDDGVLLGGLRPSHYASHLLSVARDAGAAEPRAPRLAPALARRTEMEERVRAMLDGRPRSGPLSRASVGALGLAGLIAAGLIGAVEPVRRPGPAAPLATVQTRDVADFEIAAAPVAPSPRPDAGRPAAGAAVRVRRFVPRPGPAPPAPPVPPAAPAAALFSDGEPSTVPAPRVLTWRAPSGPSASDEPRRTRVVRVVGTDVGTHYALVLPDLPAAIWRERSDEVWAYVERSVVRQARAGGGRPALGVRADRFVVAVRRVPSASVDTAAHEGYRSRREEEAASTKAGT